VRFLPNLKKNLLQYILSFRSFMHHAVNHCSQGLPISSIQLIQRRLVMLRNLLQQRLVGHRRQTWNLHIWF
jgi:hypothetical protein